jgi:alpha-L-fucosidase 2
MALSIPGMNGASFAMQENIYTGTVTGQFTLNGNEIQTNSWVSSNDTTNNFLFTQFTYSGSGTQAVTVSLAAGNGNTYPTSSGSSGSVLYYNVAADSTSTVGGYNTHQVRIAVGVVGATGTISGSTLQFTLSPGATVTLREQHHEQLRQLQLHNSVHLQRQRLDLDLDLQRTVVE